jgi:hypothetical protein
MLKSVGGAPLVGTGDAMLGARVPIDIKTDLDGLVHPGRGGMSVTPDDMHGCRLTSVLSRSADSESSPSSASRRPSSATCCSIARTSRSPRGTATSSRGP